MDKTRNIKREPELNQRQHIVQRGDIYYADLSPVTGSEQGGIRPVLIIQNDVGNRFSPTVIAAAITARQKKRLPTHVDLLDSTCGLFRDSTVMLEQIRTLDKSRLREYMGNVGTDKLRKIDRALEISVGLLPLLTGGNDQKKCQ